MEHDVVIVGGGPVGLMLAGELALAKVDVAIVERRETQELVGSRSRGINARTIELLDQRGIADRFLAEGQTMPMVSFAIPIAIGDLPARHHYGLALSQRHVERLLADWVEELAVPIHRGCEVIDFREDETSVDVALSDGRVLRAAYLVGCDGGRSLVRKKAGIAFPGWDPSISYLIAEVEMSEEPPWGMRRDAKGTYAIGKHEDGKRASVVLRDEEVTHGDTPTLDELRRALVGLYGSDFGLTQATWLSRFTDMTRQAASYRKGRVLLAGDAAHVHSPVGGQGLNLGVQDAVNMGWKLASVIKGAAPESLLDTYHSERHPVGARVLKAVMASTALGRGDARTEALRDVFSEIATTDAARRHLGAMMSGLDVHYDFGEGHPLLGRRMPDLDLVMDAGATRVFALLHEARPVLLNLSDPNVLATAPWSDRIRRVDARFDGIWELPADRRRRRAERSFDPPRWSCRLGRRWHRSRSP